MQKSHKKEKYEYEKEYLKNPKNLLKKRIRGLIRGSLYYKGYKKNTISEKILGCSWEFWIGWMESQFVEGMTWDNIKEWSIDHYIPLSYAKTKEEILKLNNYKNLRPAWLKDNLSKNDDLPQDLNEKLKELNWFD